MKNAGWSHGYCGIITILIKTQGYYEQSIEKCIFFRTKNNNRKNYINEIIKKSFMNLAIQFFVIVYHASKNI